MGSSACGLAIVWKFGVDTQGRFSVRILSSRQGLVVNCTYISMLTNWTNGGHRQILRQESWLHRMAGWTKVMQGPWSRLKHHLHERAIQCIVDHPRSQSVLHREISGTEGGGHTQPNKGEAHAQKDNLLLSCFVLPTLHSIMWQLPENFILHCWWHRAINKIAEAALSTVSLSCVAYGSSCLPPRITLYGQQPGSISGHDLPNSAKAGKDWISKSNPH